MCPAVRCVREQHCSTALLGRASKRVVLKVKGEEGCGGRWSVKKILFLHASRRRSLKQARQTESATTALRHYKIADKKGSIMLDKE